MKQHFLFTPLLPSVPKFFLLAASLMFGLLALTAPAVAETRYVEGSVIVTFKPAATLNDAKAVLNKKSLGFANHFGWLSAKRNRTTGLVRHQTKSTADLIASLKDDPTVESVEPDYLRWVNGAPNDPRFSDMWGLRNQGQTVDGTTGTSGDDVKFVEAWNEATANTNNVVVGVIDSGVDYVHPDLAGNMWVNTAELQSGGVDNDNNGYKNDYFGYDFVNGLSHPDDSGYHGTHVAGTIAAIGNNQAGVIGVNYRAKIMALKVSSDGESISTSAVILALQYATLMKGRGVNIVALNASYGGGGSSTAERAAIQAAGDAGIILCAAAGNEKASNDATPSYPANYRLSNMIVVAASDQDDALASFSNYGTTTVDLAAPGTSILSTKPSTVSVQVGSKSYVSTPITFSGLTSGLSGKLVSCGIGDVTATTTDFPAAVRGNIAFISRGTLTFEDKVKNAMAAGAIGAVIYNNVPGSFAGTMSKAGDFIPAVAISEEDGLAILPSAPTTASLVIAGDYQYLDGTSMATPHVTGAVAFAAMNFPADTVAQRIARILNHVDVKASLQGKVTSNGRLNLLKIVDANSNGVPDWLEATGPNAPVISTSGALPGVVLNDSYSQTLSATGGTSPYTWDVANGALPGGLALSPAGVLSGTPTAVGSFSFAVRVIDSVNAANAKSFTLTVASTPLSINTDPSLTNGKMGVDYHISLVAAGGTAPYTWAIDSGSLPPGLSLSAAGVLAGAPAAAGTYLFTAKVTDTGVLTAAEAFTLVIDPLPLAITTGASLPPAVKDFAYAQTLVISGGTAPFTWSVTSGSLPDGITLDPSGSINGTPTTAGPGTFTLLVTDSGSQTQTRQFSLYVEATPLVITTSSPFIPGVRGVPLTPQTLTSTGGMAPVTWALSAGALPPKVTLSPTGVLSGIPSMAGLFNFTVTATDSLFLSVNQPMQLTITSTYVKPVMDVPSFTATSVGVPFTYKVTASNYPRSFSISGLPTGLTYSATTGIISGRPTVSNYFTVTLKAANPAGTGLAVTAPFMVNALPLGEAGTFTGLVARDPAVANSLGSRFTLTVTAAGGYTARITTGVTAKAAVGFLTPATPQINVAITGGATLKLTLDGSTNSLSGFYGTQAVTAWRQTWSTTPVAIAHPATSRVGYYTIGLDLADDADKASSTIPHGSGYAAFSVTAAGTLTVAGHVADGTAFTSATIIGPGGEMPVYTSLYGNLGSLIGVPTLTTGGATPLVDNTAAGTLTWYKPLTRTRTYPAAFGPVSLTVEGKYLAAKSTGLIVLGLPDAGLADLLFDEGGLNASLTDPEVTGFTYTAAHAVLMPKALSPANPGRTSLAINKSTGLVTGTFYLKETTPALTRGAAFQGMIVRSPNGSLKAEGYFLLAQIPVKPQTILTSPILSGRMSVTQ